MLFIINGKKYIFVVESCVSINIEELKAKGCTFVDSLAELYTVSAEAQELTVEEVEGCEFTITKAVSSDQIIMLDQRLYHAEIEDDINDFIANYEQ